MGLLDWFGGAQTVVASHTAEAAQAKAATQIGQAQQYIQDKFVEAYAMDLKGKVSEKCFEKCFDPKNSDKKIDTSEAGCHAQCCDRYLDTFEHVRRTMQTRSRR
mmetsp:Transcript_24458/g.60198  ORF Transcript_24458/g.60198 Transcript_24458/m.60198 type:complete len:104 (+) Transcript_24458:145-456(+)